MFLKRVYKLRGLISAFLATIIMALAVTLYKLLGDKITGPELAFYRFVIQGFLALPIMIFRKVPITNSSKKEFVLLTARSIVMSFSIVLIYTALNYINTGTVLAIVVSSSTVFVGLFARCFLKEPLSPFHIIFIAVNIAGIFLITQPDFLFQKKHVINNHQEIILGTILSCIAMIGVSMSIVIQRMLGIMKVHHSKIVCHYAIVGFIITFVWVTCLQEWNIPSCKERIFISVSGLCSFLGQCLNTYALSKEDAVRITLINTNMSTVGFIFEFIIFSNVPDWLSGVGAVLVISTSIGVALWTHFKRIASRSDKRDSVQHLPDESELQVRGQAEHQPQSTSG